MPPRTRYTPERILDAAVALTRREGFSAVTARHVAGELGCSTAPVFTHFASMDALQEALLDELRARFLAAVLAESHADPAFAAGLGMLRFAADEPNLYAALFLTRHPWQFRWGRARRELAARMAAHPRYAALSDDARFGLVGRASIVVHGLGVELWSGRLRDASEPTLLRLLTELAEPLLDAALANGWTTDIHLPLPPTAGAAARAESA